MDTPSPYRYEQLADLIVGMIDNGALPPGARVPSVRTVSEQHRISISTALQAYRLLEDRGILVARPQSGFYVAAARRGALALPSISRPRAKASTVSISGAVATLLEHASNSALVPLGCAVPDAELLQSTRLDLALAREARQHGTRYNVYCEPRGDARLRTQRATPTTSPFSTIAATAGGNHLSERYSHRPHGLAQRSGICSESAGLQGLPLPLPAATVVAALHAGKLSSLTDAASAIPWIILQTGGQIGPLLSA